MRKTRLTLVRIFGYVIAMSLFENIWGSRSGELPRLVAAGVLLLLLLPMAVVATANLWHGAMLRFSVWDTIFYVDAMLMIGTIEELLFRGCLLQMLTGRSMKTGILISSLTFGLGHIVNLANGAELLPTLLQMIYALAIGLMLSVFMVKAKNIIPCCIFHGVFNALAAFSNEAG